MKTSILALTLVALTASTASAQPEPRIFRSKCRFKIGHSKKHDRFCTARIVFVSVPEAPDADTDMDSATPTPLPTSNLKVRCDGDTIFDGQFRTIGLFANPTLRPGMTIVTAFKPNKVQFPSLWVDAIIFTPQPFDEVPADLRLDRDERLLHGTCERE